MASSGTYSLLGQFSELVGAPQAAVRLLISILLGFPLAIIHRRTFYGKSPTNQHLYFAICGFIIGFWNYEYTILHSATALLGTYSVLKFFRGTVFSVLVTFIFNMVYLLYGYYTTATNDYDIKWTMPQCVLTLRLIGLSYDLLDGKKSKTRLSENQKVTALTEAPSLLEMAAYTYFPGSFLVGPQFSLKRYLDYVNGNLFTKEVDEFGQVKPPNSLWPGIKRACIGFIYVAMYQLGTMYVSDQYLLDPEFDNQNFFKRCFLLGLWGRCNLYKYISCWLITEGVCIVFGLTYNGQDEQGATKWDGLANVNLLTFENATEFNHYILSFNINTNQWCAEYMYKRLKFLGSKLYSQIVTLIFLAIWHGLHSGYYLCFFQEFLIMFFEKDLKPVLVQNEKLKKTVNRSFLVKALVWLLLKVYTFVFMGYSLIPFVLLSYSRYMPVFKSFYFMGHVIFLSYPILSPFIKRALKQRKERPHAE